MYAGQALEMATFTLQQMAGGGMYDQIGGGFHRYSVDEHWHIPHFEKMLYDNPQLANTYLDAFALTGDHQFAQVARGILDYLRRDMTHPKGGIFSAEVCCSRSLNSSASHGKTVLLLLMLHKTCFKCSNCSILVRSMLNDMERVE